MRVIQIFLLAVAAAAGLWAQTADMPLTNSDIQSMLTAGVPESTVLQTIRNAAFQGLVDLDASPSALTALKQKGATEQELNAVIWAQPFGAGLKQEQAEERAVPGLPGAAGVYYKTGSQWMAPNSFLVWPPLYSGMDFFSSRPREQNLGLNGSHASLQIDESQPAFYLRHPASDAWSIFKLGSHRGQRSLRLVSGGFSYTKGFTSGPEGFAASAARPIQTTHLAGDLFTVRPAQPLDSGEYVLCSAVPGSDNLNVCYAFGVRR